MTEEQKYLYKLCDRINNNTRSNILYVLRPDSYLEEYLSSEQANWVKKSWSDSIVYIPRYDKEYRIIRASENARGYKPKHVIIDSRIPLSLIRNVVEPGLMVCASCHYF